MCLIQSKKPARKIVTKFGYKLYHRGKDGKLKSLCRDHVVSLGIQSQASESLYSHIFGFHCFNKASDAEKFFEYNNQRYSWSNKNLVLVKVLCTNVLRVGRDGDAIENGWSAPDAKYDNDGYVYLNDYAFKGFPAFTCEYITPVKVIKQLS